MTFANVDPKALLWENLEEIDEQLRLIEHYESRLRQWACWARHTLLLHLLSLPMCFFFASGSKYSPFGFIQV